MILITDTQVNVLRIATIIKALDTSVANISMFRIIPLRYADAKQAADHYLTSSRHPKETEGTRDGNQGGAGLVAAAGFGGFGGPLLAAEVAHLAGPGLSGDACCCGQRIRKANP